MMTLNEYIANFNDDELMHTAKDVLDFKTTGQVTENGRLSHVARRLQEIVPVLGYDLALAEKLILQEVAVRWIKTVKSDLVDTLHSKFYDLRDVVWSTLETLVRSGCDFIGDFPIVENHGNERESTSFTIRAIIKDENYCIHPPKQSPKDIIVKTNLIKVVKYTGDQVMTVEPDLNDIQLLSTYVSGGYNVYTKL